MSRSRFHLVMGWLLLAVFCLQSAGILRAVHLNQAHAQVVSFSEVGVVGHDHELDYGCRPDSDPSHPAEPRTHHECFICHQLTHTPGSTLDFMPTQVVVGELPSTQVSDFEQLVAGVDSLGFLSGRGPPA